MRFPWRNMMVGGLLLGAVSAPGSNAVAASSCAPAGLPTTCVIDASVNANSLDQANFPTTPFATGVTFAAGSTYVLTVQNPLTTTWQYNTALPGVTVDGVAGGLSVGAMVGQVGGAPTGVGAFNIPSLGTLAANGTVVDGMGNTHSYTPGGGLTLAIRDSDIFNNAGTQTVTITQAPNVGGNVLANVNVFANQHGIGSELDTGLALAPGSYRIEVTDPLHLWSAHELASTHVSTADGLGGFELCGPVANSYPETCGTAGSIGDAVSGFEYGELVALIGGQYYGVGTGRTFSNIFGPVKLLYWDSYIVDNLGFMNVTVYQVRELAPVPEPGSLALFGAGLAGLAWLRRRRVA